MFLQEA